MAADPYRALGVQRSASADEIKKAYRKLARQYHPDNNSGDLKAEEKFKEIQGAYDILSDPEKKQAFDRGGFASTVGGQAANFDMGNLAEMLQDFISGRGGRGGQRSPGAVRGQDLETAARIQFREAINGGEVRIPVPSQDPCPDCHGSGGRRGSAMKNCPDCDGRGLITVSDGIFSSSQPCPRCHGSGRVPSERCPVCRGSGKRPGGASVRVKVPAGIKDGGRIRVAGRGEPGVGGGPPGDLYVKVQVAPSAVFERKGDNLEVELPISVTEALLGAQVRAPTLTGTKLLRIAPGTKHGAIQRLRGEGPPTLRGERGDLRYRIVIELPKKLTAEQRELVEQLAATLDGDPRSKLLEQAAQATGVQTPAGEANAA